MTEFGLDPSTTIRELKVSGYTMHLAPGLYCLVHSPAPVAANTQSGLPGIRVSPAPGHTEGAVATVGFDPDGWLKVGDGALLQVGGTGGDVLVTIYQDQHAAADPPRIQVIRMSGNSPLPPSPPDSTTPGVLAHIYGLGDVSGTLRTWVGEPESGRWIEGFSIAATASASLPDIQYQAVLGRGWLSPWSDAGQFCGSRGMSLPILGLRVKLRGSSAETHRVILSARFLDGTEIGPVGDDEPCEAPSFAALEAFHLCFEAFQPSAPATRARPARRR